MQLWNGNFGSVYVSACNFDDVVVTPCLMFQEIQMGQLGTI